MINLNEVGAFASATSVAGIPVRFGLYLPGITPQAGYEVVVRVIHEADRLLNPEIHPLDFRLDPIPHSSNDLWQKDVIIPSIPGTSLGWPGGIYLYDYQIWQKVGGNRNLVTRSFTDPFARETADAGDLAAFAPPGLYPGFPWTDQDWKVPDLEDLVVYKLH